MIPGSATPCGTERYAARFPAAAPGSFRRAGGRLVSSLGFGTFSGADDDRIDAGYAATLRQALLAGSNVLDTAAAYRHQRSEQVIGRVLAALTAEGAIARDEVVLISKAGFLPFDSRFVGDYRRYVEERFLAPGIVTADDVVAGGHCLAPRFLADQIETSRRHLGCETVDLYLLHNPETQLRGMARGDFLRRLRAAFELLEAAVDAGDIRGYGISSFGGLRLPPEAGEYLDLREVLACATTAGGAGHHFQALLVPFNLTLHEAWTRRNQRLPGEPEPVSLLAAAERLSLAVFAGSALHRARLCRGLPRELDGLLDGAGSDPQRALQLARSAPGVATAVVATSDPEHAAENLALLRHPPLPRERFCEVCHD